MNATKMKATRKLAKQARELRNASLTNYAFDYWHKVMKEHESSLKTEEKK